MMQRRSALSVLATFGLAGAVLVATASSAQAVEQTTYDLANLPGCTLSDALTAAQGNAETAGGACPAGSMSLDTIVLDADTYTGHFVVDSGLLRIEGHGASSSALNGDNSGVVLTIGAEADVVLSGLSVTGGKGGSGSLSGLVARPGGILNRGTLSLDHVRVHGNTGATGFGRGFQSQEVIGGPGGILNYGDLTVGEATSVDGNTGGAGGVGTTGTVVIYEATDGFQGGTGGAGGVDNFGHFELLTNATGISGNTGGVGGKGGPGGGGSSNCDGGNGGQGGTGGPGGVRVRDDSFANGVAAMVSTNTAGAGGVGGSPGASGDFPDLCYDGTPGSVGDSGETDILKGGQSLHWQTDPPTRAVTGSQLNLLPRSTSNVVPEGTASGGCSGSFGQNGLTVDIGTDASSDCTVQATAVGNDWFLPAATPLQDTIDVVDPIAVTVNQADGQLDPVYDGSASFTVEFAEPVTGLNPNNLNVTGVSLPYTVTVTSSGVASYNVKVDWQGDGPVSVSVPADAAETADGIPNAESTSTDNTVTMTYDTNAPTASPTLDPAANGSGWNDSDVTVTWNWTDAESGLDNCDASTTSSGEGSQIAVSSTCSDIAGNSTTETVYVNVDATDPTLSPSVSPFVSALQGPSPTADPGASDEGSGVDDSGCDATSTAAIGAFTVDCSATDVAGNTASGSASYIVANAFRGFQSPLPKAKVKKAATIPVKFTVGNYSGSQLSTSATVRVELKTKNANGSLGDTIGNPLSCPYSQKAAAYQCKFKAAGSVKTDGTKYFLVVYQRIAGSWYQVPDGSSVTNPNVTQVTFK
jgi:hypothetical protein